MSFCSLLVCWSRSKSARLAKSLRMMPFWSVMTMFSSVRPSTANLRIFWMPSTFLRFWTRSEPGLGKMMTLAVTGFWSCLEKLLLGHHDRDARLVHVVEGLDLLRHLPDDRAAQVDVALEVGDGPALHVEDGPGVGALGDEVVADEDALGPEGRLLVLDVELVRLADRVGDALGIELARDEPELVLGLDGRAEELDHRGRRRDPHEDDDGDDGGEHDAAPV